MKIDYGSFSTPIYGGAPKMGSSEKLQMLQLLLQTMAQIAAQKQNQAQLYQNDLMSKRQMQSQAFYR